MGFKEFFSFNLQKIISTIFLIIFAPLPFFVVALGGLAPPILILLVIPVFSMNPLMVVLLGLFFVIHALFAYLISCIIIWIFGKITREKYIQWILISILLVILVVASFFHIYGIGDAGGGFQKPNILDLFFNWTKP